MKTALSGWTASGAVLLFAAGIFVGRTSAKWMGKVTTAESGKPTRRAAIAGAALVHQATLEPASDPAQNWQIRWNDLQRTLPSAAREKAMAEALRTLATTEPARALALAEQEKNFRARQLFIQAALRGWATVTPVAAMEWTASNLFETERLMAVEAVIEGGMARREDTVRAVSAISERDAAQGSEYGRILIAALAKEGDFAGALRFARDNTSGNSKFWLSSALYSWAQYRPEEAAAALREIMEPAAYNEAVHGLILGWSSNDPATLIEFAQQLPAGPVRAEALNQALQNWVTHDPVAASRWLAEHPSAPEIDSGAVKLATSPFLVEHNVETALSWANSVADPRQRTIALSDVLGQWAKRDVAAARRYVASAEGMTADDRATLMKELEAPAEAP